ncbi:single-stranded DNA-binding protein [Undibacterium fentianense]|uniref:Single-stranded DNA-binding protein n=1 Tax=Undibacterium fentianense TaxID=2828728 RepID=A0A941E541_9BURK|nr:single-stranded DNA-binding protein [Undibacterium fentianense]MBR7801116.1 single-stranded DNA-binding protein [Undibacterium fentianense]
MIDAHIAGRLFGHAEQRQGQSGSNYVTCKIKVLSDEGDSLICNVISFNTAICQALLAAEDGESLSLSGALTPKVWTDKHGVARPAIDLVAHRFLSQTSSTP